MKLELKIAINYIASNRKKRGISFVSGFAIAGIILATTALITTLSVMNGFHDNIRNSILNTMHHGYITSTNNEIEDWEKEINKIKASDGIVNASAYIENFALIASLSSSNGAIIRGILTDADDNQELQQNIKYGKLELPYDKNKIIIGIGIANKIKAIIGEEVSVIVPVQQNGILTPQIYNFEIAAIFDTGITKYNNSLAFINLHHAQKLFNMQNNINAIKIKVDDIFNADKIILKAAKSTNIKNYITIDWMQENVNFINAVNLEKRMIRIILFLIIAIATFNIVSITLITVKNKRIDIALLRTIGMTPKRIVMVFFYQAVLIGLIGIIIGLFCGLLLAYNIQEVVAFIENIFNFKLLTNNAFYTTQLPSVVKFSDVFSVLSGSFILVVLSSIYPAISAGKVQIAEVFRYE